METVCKTGSPLCGSRACDQGLSAGYLRGDRHRRRRSVSSAGWCGGNRGRSLMCDLSPCSPLWSCASVRRGEIDG
jgi:hypothetical protein